jgi:hypothetical protein
VLLLGVVCSLAQAHAQPVGPADYPEIARLLREPVGEAPAATGFEALWREPEAYRGRPVRVEGVARRAFRQPAAGAFPALVELWLTDAAGNPLGVMFPDRGVATPAGAPVAFAGRLLRLVDYQGGADARRAPLIVGPGPPTMKKAGGGGRDRTEWLVAAALGAFVLLVLGVQHLRRPRPLPQRPGPRPAFEPTPGEGGSGDG